MNNQPKPDSKTYDDLISDVKKGIIKAPKIQWDFVWGLKATTKLSDSILKGYSTIKNADRDGFPLNLGNILDSYLGRDVVKLWNLDWPFYDEKQLCTMLARGRSIDSM